MIAYAGWPAACSDDSTSLREDAQGPLTWNAELEGVGRWCLNEPELGEAKVDCHEDSESQSRAKLFASVLRLQICCSISHALLRPNAETHKPEAVETCVQYIEHRSLSVQLHVVLALWR
ncbi:unnamed protein product [Polarella glacialis]|uniref:Uncharacterized protein n=1 Tax=Polarella glacialis TaxID=89957 RepID=A0A813GI64_POLGL|nr:unnamed protein product [Polarella glacialis]